MPDFHFNSAAWLFLASTVSAAVLQPLQVINGQLQTNRYATNGFTISLPTRLTAQPLNSSTGLGRVRPSCNTDQFGSGLNFFSCSQVIQMIILFEGEFDMGPPQERELI